MTLQEYLSQENPTRRPKVVLQEGEFICGVTHDYSMYEKHTTIFLMGGYEALEHNGVGLRNEFVLKNGSGYLHTIDSDGNIRGLSCFYIQKKEN